LTFVSHPVVLEWTDTIWDLRTEVDGAYYAISYLPIDFDSQWLKFDKAIPDQRGQTGAQLLMGPVEGASIGAIERLIPVSWHQHRLL